MTANDPIKRPLRLPRQSADGPTSQVRNMVTTMLITIIKRAGRAHKRGDQECRQMLQTPGQHRPANHESATRGPTRRRESKPSTKLAPTLTAALEQDKEVDRLCPIRKELDGEQDVFRAAHQMIKTAADSVIGISLLCCLEPDASIQPIFSLGKKNCHQLIAN